MIAVRLGFSMILGVIVTVALFYLMQALIAHGRSAMTKNESIHLVNFVRVNQPMHVQTKDLRPKQPPPPDQPPPPIQQNFRQVQVAKVSGYGLRAPDLKVGAAIQGGGFSISDGDYLPLVKVQPMYPERALENGLSGWVIVSFTVTSQGSVENPVVVQDCGWIQGPHQKGDDCHDSPNSVFDSAAVRAARKFKYKPRVIDGKPVPTADVENKITFDLVNDNSMNG